MASIRVCELAELAPGAAVRVDGANPIAVFRAGDEVFAIDDTCTHAQSSLAEGYLEGETVECAFHSARFCLRTGKVLAPPASRPVRTYPVKIEGGAVFVETD